MVKNISIAVLAIAAVALGVFAFTQYSSAQDLSKQLGRANFTLFCLEQRDALILGKGDKDDAADLMATCENSFNDDQKQLIPKV